MHAAQLTGERRGEVRISLSDLESGLTKRETASQSCSVSSGRELPHEHEHPGTREVTDSCLGAPRSACAVVRLGARARLARERNRERCDHGRLNRAGPIPVRWADPCPGQVPSSRQHDGDPPTGGQPRAARVAHGRHRCRERDGYPIRTIATLRTSGIRSRPTEGSRALEAPHGATPSQVCATHQLRQRATASDHRSRRATGNAIKERPSGTRATVRSSIGLRTRSCASRWQRPRRRGS